MNGLARSLFLTALLLCGTSILFFFHQAGKGGGMERHKRVTLKTGYRELQEGDGNAEVAEYGLGWWPFHPSPSKGQADKPPVSEKTLLGIVRNNGGASQGSGDTVPYKETPSDDAGTVYHSFDPDSVTGQNSSPRPTATLIQKVLDQSDTIETSDLKYYNTGCCSVDYITCGKSMWCNLSKGRCESSCAGKWLVSAGQHRSTPSYDTISGRSPSSDPAGTSKIAPSCYDCPLNSYLKSRYGCSNTFDDCLCDSGFKKYDRSCIFCQYQCPPYSYPKAYLPCYRNIDDCECYPGFYRIGYYCVPDREPTRTVRPPVTTQTSSYCYDCPENSHLKSKYSCSNTFDDCSCNDGYVKWHSKTCKYCYFKCPMNSKPKETLSCHENFNDCDCYPGYYKEGNNCLPKVSAPNPTPDLRSFPISKKCYDCPDNSYLKLSYYCSNTFDDCVCDRGYKKLYDNTCKFCDYQCPEHSYRKLDLECYWSFDNCDCDFGYYKEGNYCKPKQDSIPQTKSYSPCYDCPPNSYLKYNEHCSNTFDDCTCNVGYVKRHGNKCKYCNFQCPSNSKPKENMNCPETFDDCDCYPGYYKAGYNCLPKISQLRPTPDVNYYAGSITCYDCPDNSYLKLSYYCSNTFDDCVCDYGYKKQYDNTCKYCDYQCPDYSYRKPDLECYQSFDDCDCDLGYYKEGYYCNPKQDLISRPNSYTPCYDCPPNSYLKSSEYCSNTFGDCTCDEGYKMYHSTCKYCDYKCTEHSYRKPNLECYQSFDDCECYPGYQKENYFCKQQPGSLPQPKYYAPCYICPPNSNLKSTDDCSNTLDDCICNYGYKKWYDSTCKYCDYMCPEYSSRKLNLACYQSFEDCDCDPGYFKEGSYCKPDISLTPEPKYYGPCYDCPPNSHLKINPYCSNTLEDCICDFGYKKWDNNYCKFCNYECPAYSHRKENLPCYHSFEDCDCYDGYYKDGYSCKPNPIPTKKPCYACPSNSYLGSQDHCSNTFHDCVCEYGFVKSYGKCIPW